MKQLSYFLLSFAFLTAMPDAPWFIGESPEEEPIEEEFDGDKPVIINLDPEGWLV